MSNNSAKESYILRVYQAENTVFTARDLALLWQEADFKIVRKRIYRYVKAGKLLSLRKGVYAKNNNYDKYELANKLYTPSYISFETVLARSGVVFQFYSQILIASYLTREITVDGRSYSYRKIKDVILTDSTGVEQTDHYFIASPERAFLDVLYLNKDYHFDNLTSLDWPTVFNILPIYHNQRMEKQVQKHYDSLRSA